MILKDKLKEKIKSDPVDALVLDIQQKLSSYDNEVYKKLQYAMI